MFSQPGKFWWIKIKIVLYLLWFGVTTGGGHLESGFVSQADTNLGKGRKGMPMISDVRATEHDFQTRSRVDMS